MNPFLLFMVEINCVLAFHYLFEEHFTLLGWAGYLVSAL